MNHKYISWNIYIVPSNVNSNIGLNREPTKLLRSSTSTSLGNDNENFIGRLDVPLSSISYLWYENFTFLIDSSIKM